MNILVKDPKSHINYSYNNYKNGVAKFDRWVNAKSRKPFEFTYEINSYVGIV